VPGIVGNCDANAFNGPLDRVAAYGKGGMTPAPGPVPKPEPTPQETIDGLRIAVAHLADVVVPKAVSAAAQRDEALAEARAIREQFVGPRPS